MKVKIEESWENLLRDEFGKEYFTCLTQRVRHEYATTVVYPCGKNIFRAFDLSPVEQVKVVIIGQDPYHGPNQANGLCFSVNDNVPIPPSLQNIFKEIQRDLGTASPTSGNLDRWAQQGVLLLNSVLTVRQGEAASHQNIGWELFTDAVVAALTRQKSNIVYMLWGAYAQRKGGVIDEVENLVLKSVHPSPLSAYRGFIGCGHFGQANAYLASMGLEPIIW